MDIKILWDDLKQAIHAQKKLQWGWIKTILQGKMDQNCSTVMWKTHCQYITTAFAEGGTPSF